MGHYFDAQGNAVKDAGAYLFQEWDEGAGSVAAGEYFAEYVHVLLSQDDVYRDLYTKYNDAAISAFMACSAVLSAFDACVDAVIAAQLAEITFAEAVLAPFTGGRQSRPARSPRSPERSRACPRRMG
ncbi:MAG: hypothetical protein HGA51_10180 [Demequinaceae bacterium]|nr:hypothetical protein [Demequinaceae bacterium]